MKSENERSSSNSKNLFANNWFETFSSIQNNVEEFTLLHSLTKSELVNELVQTLLKESTEDECKLKCLIVLQEEGSFLLETTELLLEVIGSLYKVFHQTKESLYFLKGQILVTITSLLLTSDELSSQKIISQLGITLDIAIEIIRDINHAKNHLLRIAACNCLMEIEFNFPGLLISRLDEFHAFCLQEKTHVFQSYASLFSLVLKHSNKQFDDPFSSTHLFVAKENPAHWIQASPISPLLSNMEQRQAISYLVEMVPLMSVPTTVQILENLIDIIKNNKDIPPTILKSIVLRFINMQDMQLFHVVCRLQLTFGNVLFSEADVSFFLNQLVLMINLPVLLVTQRLIYLDWMHYYLTAQNAKGRFMYNFRPDLQVSLCPTVFDGSETQGRKMSLLSILFSIRFQKDPVASTKLLMGCLITMYNIVKCSWTHKAVSVIFRTLYIYFAQNNNTTMESEIEQFVIKFAKLHPEFYQHICNFIYSIRETFPENCLMADRLLKEWTNHIVKQSSNIKPTELKNYLLILEKITKEPSRISQPKQVLTFLLKLKAICESGDWIIGNCILSICSSILKYQNSTYFYREIGEVLFELITKFRDVDIQDEARLLYMLLTNLSTSKVSSLLEKDVSSSIESHSITSFVSGSAAYGSASPVILIETPVLKLTRCGQFIQEQLETNLNSSISANSETVIKLYQDFIKFKQHIPPLQLQYYLEFEKDLTIDFDIIYAVDLKFECPPWINIINGVMITAVSKGNRVKVNVKIRPAKIVVPLSLNIRAFFNSVEGRTYCSLLQPVKLVFEDYFLPIPVPPDYVSLESNFRFHLFEDLWTAFVGSAEAGLQDSKCEQSVTVLEISTTKLDEIINKTLKPYLIRSIGTDSPKHLLGIFLLPSHHLLLKMEPKDSITVVHLVTDTWELLPLVGQFLKQLEE